MAKKLAHYLASCYLALLFGSFYELKISCYALIITCSYLNNNYIQMSRVYLGLPYKTNSLLSS